jgi:hypothetical protein
MTIDQLIAPIVSVGGLAIAMTTTYLTVRQYYDKRRIEDRQRQGEELDRLQAARQRELDEYADGRNKSYAAERDFNHLMRKYDALSLSLNTLMDYQRNEVQSLETDLKEVKGMLNAILIHITGSETAVMRFLRRPEKDKG